MHIVIVKGLELVINVHHFDNPISTLDSLVRIEHYFVDFMVDIHPD